MSNKIKDSNPNSDWGSIKTGKYPINPTYNKRLFVVDNFFSDPLKVREFALQQWFFDDEGFLGLRTRKQYFWDGLKESFENILNKKITKWEDMAMNARFQSHKAGIPGVYHADNQTWAGAIYLNPDAPYEAGTSFWAHKETRGRHAQDPVHMFDGIKWVDQTPYTKVDEVGNIFNRLVIWDAQLIHAAPVYFGHNVDTARLTQVFFFNTED